MFLRVVPLALACCSILWITEPVSAVVLLHESFDHPDGGLEGLSPTPGPGTAWNAGAGGGVNPVQVAGGAAVLVQTQAINGEDIASNFGDQVAPTVVYARFDFWLPAADNVDLAPRPELGDPGVGTEGLWFVTLREQSANSTLRARTGVLAPEAGGDFRLAISADSGDLLTDGQIWPTELNFDTVYRAVISYDTSSGNSRLWLDPESEDSPSLLDTGGAGIQIDRFGLRQHTTYEGKQFVDNLVVATTFAEALMPPSPGVPGDYNGDGRVDAGDYVRWRNHLGDPDENSIHNNGDGGDVGISDYGFWKARYGDPAESGGGGLALAVPEAATAVLFAIGWALLAALHRRSSKRSYKTLQNWPLVAEFEFATVADFARIQPPSQTWQLQPRY